MPETWEPRPVPPANPETERFWSAAADGTLLLRECPDCGLVYHYPSALCPDCFTEAEWREASGDGTVYSFSLLRNHGDWPEDDLPVVFAYVELEEGPRVITNILDCPPQDVEVGMDVTVAFVPTDTEDVAIPVFVPAE
ncbi:Zn-ribbon domain-containing OB-fold protein [Salinadaptatus halalkaliphilus]|uniref:Zn-ribbon domain-containing OB-fold protein n=1 Tax=Salinadaptatus halalkaliphilus TaxID=2419781 RepID=A0A4S3TPR9_9EURY|nr:Zn-ribbon domain-containing OB-fold protein [Salinadaptatus halalkaliphilus]